MAKANVQFTKDNEYYTPKTVVKYFGQFDYDPATTKEKAQEFGIKAVVLKIQDSWELEFIDNYNLKEVGEHTKYIGCKTTQSSSYPKTCHGCARTGCVIVNDVHTSKLLDKENRL